MGKRIDAETRVQIAQTYLENEGMTYAKVAKRFGVAMETARKIIKEDLEAGAGIKPDRRREPELPPDWMQHVAPLHKHKQAELDKAKQELRDFMATLRQLMEGNT